MFKKAKQKLPTVIVIAIVIIVILGMAYLLFGSQSFKRDLVDLKSEYGGGLERTINIYTANGDIMATYTGKIDIETNDGGYVKFDYDGKRYIYYNCFVETIAEY